MNENPFTMIRHIAIKVAESEIFGWIRIPKNTKNSPSRIFLSDSGSPIESGFTLHS